MEDEKSLMAEISGMVNGVNRSRKFLTGQGKTPGSHARFTCRIKEYSTYPPIDHPPSTIERISGQPA